MYSGKLVFTQVLEHVPQHSFRRRVQRYQGNRYVKRFTCQDQFRAMSFAQLSYRESLRDIRSVPGPPARQALAHGHPWPGRSQHPGRCQRAARLAHLCRLGPDAHSHCSPALCRRLPLKVEGSKVRGVQQGRRSRGQSKVEGSQVEGSHIAHEHSGSMLAADHKDEGNRAMAKTLRGPRIMKGSREGQGSGLTSPIWPLVRRHNWFG